MHLNGWVDGIGFDGSHTDAQHLAQRTIQAWHQLRDSLTSAGLVVNSHKTAFIVTDKIIHKELNKLLSPHDPPIQSVMRDLGIDHTAGRKRRIATLQQRFRKNKQNQTPKPQAAQSQNTTQATQRRSPACGFLGI